MVQRTDYVLSEILPAQDQYVSLSQDFLFSFSFFQNPIATSADVTIIAKMPIPSSSQTQSTSLMGKFGQLP